MTRRHRRLGTDLSAREVEILAMVANGKANREIAKRLFLAEETIKSHVGSILMKLGARNRAHAVALGYADGVIALCLETFE